MDQPDLDEPRHIHALRGLARINSWSGSAGILWAPLRRLAQQIGVTSLRLLDIATGAGDVPVRLWHQARRAGIALEIDACDLSSRAVAFAQSQAEQRSASVRFFVWNALADPLPGPYDVVSCSLFLHHLDEAQAVLLLRRMKEMAARLVLINDLRRSFTGYLLAYLGSRILSTSRVVHSDGPQSVAAAFRPNEVLELAQQAGLQGATVQKRWPYRLLLQWHRGSGTSPGTGPLLPVQRGKVP
jgi:2-polyprenyl-3-methyl-5-hydroxy-6-metoxy-1,4-benzoquinol methylase